MDAGLLSRLTRDEPSIDGVVAERLFAAVAALVARFSRDAVVTIDCTGRALQRLQAETAHGAQPSGRYPITIDTAGEPTLTELTTRLRSSVAAAAAAPRIPGDPSGCLVHVGAADDVIPACELGLILHHRDDALTLAIDAEANLFEPESLDRFAASLMRIVEGGVVQPAQSLARVDLLSADDRDMVLHGWNDTHVPRVGPQVMHRLFEAQAEKTPDAIAAEFAGKALSYAELNARANLLAADLASRGVGPDVIVGICFERSHELLVSILAIHKAGGAFLPLDPDLPRDRVRYMLEDTACRLLLVQEALHDRVGEITRDLPLELCVVATASTGEESRRAAAAANLPDRAAPEHLAYVIYTSGSTGRPKGVLLPHRALCNHALWFADALDITACDRMLQHASISFDAAMAEVFAPLVAGATVVLAAPKAHREIMALPELLRRERITLVQMVPSALRVLVALDALAQCTTLRYLVSGGEALDALLAADVRQRLPAVRLGNFYGPTEAAVDATCFEVTGERDALGVLPIGTPVANACCRILDPLLGLAPIGVPGELYIGGLGLAHGYLNLPERTAASFVADPYAPGERLYRTGDLVRYRPDGRIEYIGRIDTQVKLRGYRIELSEVEGPLLAHPAIREAAVVLREDAPGESQLVAYVVLRDGAVLTASELRAVMRAALPAWMVPSAFCFLPALPLTSNAKLDRRALPAPVKDVIPAAESAQATLLDPLERSLQAIWERTLDIAPIGPDDDFFALGGHSLKAIRVLAGIEQEHGITLRAATLFDAPTIRTLAVRMRDERRRDISTVIPVQPKGARLPLFFAPGAGGELFVFDALARALGNDQPLHVLDMYVFDEIAPGAADLTLADVAARMVADIRRVQPEGPYQLAGYSLGGNIVYEMAQQLVRRGDEVRLLALLDCDGPSYPHVQPFATRTAKHVVHALLLRPVEGVRYLGSRFGKLSRYVGTPDEEAPSLYADQEEAQLVPEHVIASLETALTPVLRAWERYEPEFYAGAALIVRADIRRPMIGVIDDDPHLGWGPIIGGGVLLERIACSHFDILRPEFSAELATILARHLASADGTPSPISDELLLTV